MTPLADRLAETLRWFVDRRSPIQWKFNLHGPQDTGAAMDSEFDNAVKLLAEFDALPAEAQQVPDSAYEQAIAYTREMAACLADGSEADHEIAVCDLIERRAKELAGGGK